MGHTYRNGDRTYWTVFSPGPLRRNLTERLTRRWLKAFMVYVCDHGRPWGESQKKFVGIAFHRDLPDEWDIIV